MQRIGKIKWPGHVELFHRGVVVEQLKKLNFCRTQIDDSRLNLRLVLDAQQLDAVEIDLGNVSGFEAVAADLDDFVVIIQIGFCQIENGLCLEQSSRTPSRNVNSRLRWRSSCSRFGNPRALLCAFEDAVRACDRARADS